MPYSRWKNGCTKIGSESEKEYKDQEMGTNGKMNKQEDEKAHGSYIDCG